MCTPEQLVGDLGFVKGGAADDQSAISDEVALKTAADG
jgi:hypothetical protein